MHTSNILRAMTATTAMFITDGIIPAPDSN